MPIYEYRCPPCDHTFETLIRTSSDVAHCPRCGSINLAKQFSIPAAPQAGASSSSALPICGDNRPSPLGCGGGRCATGMCSMD
jgi:putative FmdB family regulatory protein